MQPSHRTRSRSSLPEPSDTTPAHDLFHPASEPATVAATVRGDGERESPFAESPPLLPMHLASISRAEETQGSPSHANATSTFRYSMLSSTSTSSSSPGDGPLGPSGVSRTTFIDSVATDATQRLESTYNSLSFSSPIQRRSLNNNVMQQQQQQRSASFGSGLIRNPFQVQETTIPYSMAASRTSSTLSAGLFASDVATGKGGDDDLENQIRKATEASPSLPSTTTAATSRLPMLQQQSTQRQQGYANLPLGSVGENNTLPIYGGFSDMVLGGLTSSSSNSSIRGLAAIGGVGNAGKVLGGSATPSHSTLTDRERSLDLQVEKSRLLEQLRNMREDVDQLEVQLQALKRKKARSNTTSLAQRQRQMAKEALDMRKLLFKLNSTDITPVIHSLDDENKSGKRDRTSLISNGQLFRSSVSTSNMSGLDRQLIQQLKAFTNITFNQIRSQLEPFEETPPTISTVKSSAFPRAESSSAVIGNNNDDDDAHLTSKSRYYHYQGSCYQLDFDVKFTVREPDLVLEGLEIKVPVTVEAELGAFLEKATKESLLLPFFRTFHRYAQMNYQRRKLYNTLAKRYPRLVVMASLNKDQSSKSLSPEEKDDDNDLYLSSSSSSSSDNDNNNHTKIPSSSSRRKRKRNGAILPGKDGAQVLSFRGSRRTDMELILNWRIHVDPHGQLTPLLRLLPKVTSHWKQADHKAVVENIPVQFLRLLEMKGVEGAVVTILKSVYGQEAATAVATTASTSSSTSKAEGGQGEDGGNDTDVDEEEGV